MTSSQENNLIAVIRKATKCISAGSGGTSDASEATLLAILAELRDNNSLNEILVTDTAGIVHIRRTTVNADTGVITTQYLDPQTQIVSAPTFPVLASSADWELLEIKLIDDVANNGTGAIVPYSELYKVAVNGTRTLIATVDEKGSNYTLLGTRRNASEIGVNAKTGANQLVLRGPSTWSPTEAIQQFMYAVINIASPLNPPTYRGSNNVVSELFTQESSEYIVLTGTDKFDVTNIQITANAGDIIKISYNEITI